MDKVVASAAEAVADIPSGSTLAGAGADVTVATGTQGGHYRAEVSGSGLIHDGHSGFV
ncbi:hypothetical protein ACWEP4_42650 [Streptomyces sp. NPDC004227]